MRVAIISDVHGNLEALSVVLEYLKNENINEIYCLGDIVGYGPNPNECVSLISESCKISIIGNHDHAALGLTSIEYFNDFAKLSTYWTRSVLTEESKDYLISLEFTHEKDNFMLVHSSPSGPIYWNYVLSENDARRELNSFDQQVCFIGHSHFPIVFSLIGYSRKNSFMLDNENKYIVNVGSVGQPRDGDSRTCFCIFNTEKKQIDYVRLAYDVENTCQKIREAGLPHFLADRLLRGY